MFQFPSSKETKSREIVYTNARQHKHSAMFTYFNTALTPIPPFNTELKWLLTIPNCGHYSYNITWYFQRKVATDSSTPVLFSAVMWSETEQKGQGWLWHSLNRKWSMVCHKKTKPVSKGCDWQQHSSIVLYSDVIRNRTNRTGMVVTQPEEKMVTGTPQTD